MIHFIHLLVRPSSGKLPLHVNKLVLRKTRAHLPLEMPPILGNGWRIQADSLDQLHLLLPLILPAADIIIGLPVLQSLQHGFVGH